jgi:hypothetical protein
MKAYIITLTQVPESVHASHRALLSALNNGIDHVEQAHGVWREEARAAADAEGLTIGEWDDKYSNADAVIGNFVAQYRLWKAISRGSEPAIIMEHDAVVVAPISRIPPEFGFVNLGKPSFGRVPAPREEGFYPLFSRATHLPGAHGYYLTPAFADQLVSMARRRGVQPVDLFISPQRFAGIYEYYPWPIEAHDTFTTIQKPRGCVSKHNYGPEYKIL